MMLNTKDIIFERGDNGQLIPREIILETLDDKPTVKIIPLTRGQLQEIYSKATSSKIEDKLESDNDIIKIGLIEPKLNEDEIKSLKPKYATAISIAILAASLDIEQLDINKKTEDLISSEDSELKKK